MNTLYRERLGGYTIKALPKNVQSEIGLVIKLLGSAYISRCIDFRGHNGDLIMYKIPVFLALILPHTIAIVIITAHLNKSKIHH